MDTEIVKKSAIDVRGQYSEEEEDDPGNPEIGDPEELDGDIGADDDDNGDGVM